jgi:hypothetical protein
MGSAARQTSLLLAPRVPDEIAPATTKPNAITIELPMLTVATREPYFPVVAR